VAFNDPADGAAIAERAGTAFNPHRDISICRIRDELRLGGVIFSHFTGESISMHSASWDPHWINRDMLWVTFDYPFNQLGVQRIFGQVPEDNRHAQEFNTKVGFKEVARIEGVFRGPLACVVMCLERQDCRFLNVQPRLLQRNIRIH